MTIKLEMNDEQLKTIAGQAIMRAIDEKQRDALVAQAIEYLLRQPNNGYGRPMDSPLQTAFQQALHGVVHEACRERIKDDPMIRAKIKELVERAVTKALNDKSDDLTNRLAISISSWLAHEKD